MIRLQWLANTEALANDYELFHAFYCARLQALQGCKPHEGHRILAEWESRGLIDRVATQNVDGFHNEAGNQKVDELHGRIHAIRCQTCHHEATVEAFLAKQSCASCGGKLRPGIVLFGEMLPEDAWNKAVHAIKTADIVIVIVIGTSLQVYPVNQLPKMTRGKLVYINREVDGFEQQFDLIFEGSAKETLKQIDAAI